MSAPSRRPVLTVSLALVVLTTTIILAARGWSFYWMSIQDRPEHPDFRTLRPSGMLGNGYGWVAALLIILNLSYLVRRRLGGTRFGSMAVWLDVHVFTGLMIASLVSFHSAFQLRTPIATTSTISLAMVVAHRRARPLPPLPRAREHARSGSRRRSTAFEAEFPGMREDLVAAMAKRPGPAVAANANLLTRDRRDPRVARRREEPQGRARDDDAAQDDAGRCAAPRATSTGPRPRTRAPPASARCCARGAASTGSSRCS